MKKSLLLEIDKEQAEWVVVAYLAKDSRMLEVVQTPLDAHATTGHLISRVPFDVIKREAKILGHETDPAKIEEVRKELFPEILSAEGFVPRNMVIRQMGKKSNHALNYDMSDRRFSLENEVPERDSKKITRGYYNGYPGIKQNFHGGVQRQLGVDRTLTNCFNRKRRFLGPWGPDLWKEAYSFIPQSTVVDVVNRALESVYLYEQKSLDLRIHNHDSLVLQAWYETSEDLYEICTRVCEYLTPTLHYNNFDFTIRNEVKAGKQWGHNMVALPLSDFTKFEYELGKIESGE